MALDVDGDAAGALILRDRALGAQAEVDQLIFKLSFLDNKLLFRFKVGVGDLEVERLIGHVRRGDSSAVKAILGLLALSFVHAYCPPLRRHIVAVVAETVLRPVGVLLCAVTLVPRVGARGPPKLALETRVVLVLGQDLLRRAVTDATRIPPIGLRCPV